MTATQRVDVERLSELLAKATPGPWFVVTGKNISVGPCPGKHVALCNYDNGPIEKANAALIAEMHKVLPALLQQLAERDAEVERWKDIASQINTDWIPANRKMVERAEAAERAREADIRAIADNAGWIRDDGRTYLSIRVADGADLSCKAFRRDAIAAFLAANGGES